MWSMSIAGKTNAILSGLLCGGDLVITRFEADGRESLNLLLDCLSYRKQYQFYILKELF